MNNEEMEAKIKEQGHKIELLTDIVSKLAKENERIIDLIGKLSFCIGKIVGAEIPPEITKFAQGK